MNITNVALVRATNIIPIDGIVHPISEVPYLRKEKGTEFSFAINDLLKRKGILKPIDWNKLDAINEIEKENNQILNEYLPYSSSYNSMVLWSLNGLVPDDMNNTFSNKTCAIIDGLEEQIKQAEITSLIPTDTAIKGNVVLSNNASILINKEKYNKLTQEEKEKLSKLNLSIIIFDGKLNDAINKELVKTGKYTAETLSLRREDDGYIKSNTSKELRETIRAIANENNIAQVQHWNVITGQNDELDKLEKVREEFNNSLIVTDFYKRCFFEYLFSKMDIDNTIKNNAVYFPDSSIYMEELCDEIEKIGINKYKKVVENYNKSLEFLIKDGKLPTPQEIVNSIKENKKIDLISMIKELENKNYEQSIERNESVEEKKLQTSTIYKEYIKYRANCSDITKVLSFSDYCKQLYNYNTNKITVDEEKKEETKGKAR